MPRAASLMIRQPVVVVSCLHHPEAGKSVQLGEPEFRHWKIFLDEDEGRELLWQGEEHEKLFEAIAWERFCWLLSSKPGGLHQEHTAWPEEARERTAAIVSSLCGSPAG